MSARRNALARMLGGMAVTDAGARLDSKRLDYALREQEQAHQRQQMEIAAKALDALLNTAGRGLDAYTDSQAEAILAGERPLEQPPLPAADVDQMTAVGQKAMYSGKPTTPQEVLSALSEAPRLAGNAMAKLGRAAMSPIDQEARRRAKRLAVERADSRFRALSPALMEGQTLRNQHPDAVGAVESLDALGKVEVSPDEFDSVLGKRMAAERDPRAMIDADPVLGLLPDDMREAMAAQIRQADAANREAQADKRWKRAREEAKDAREVDKAEREAKKLGLDEKMTRAKIRASDASARANDALAGWRNRRGYGEDGRRDRKAERKELLGLATDDVKEAQRIAREVANDLERLRRDRRKIDGDVAVMLAKGEVSEEQAAQLKQQMAAQLDDEIASVQRAAQQAQAEVDAAQDRVVRVRRGEDPYAEASQRRADLDAAEQQIQSSARERGLTPQKAKELAATLAPEELAALKARSKQYEALGLSPEAAGLWAIMEMLPVIEERQRAATEQRKVDAGLEALKRREAAADAQRGAPVDERPPSARLNRAGINSGTVRRILGMD